MSGASIARPTAVGTMAVSRCSSRCRRVLLVHGAGGDGWQWRAVLADLAEAGYAAHALSLSGHGCSEPILSGLRYS